MAGCLGTTCSLRLAKPENTEEHTGKSNSYFSFII